MLRMFRICSEAVHNGQNFQTMFRQCSESVQNVSDNAQNVQIFQAMFRMFRICSYTVHPFQTLFRIYSKCSECSESVKNFQNLFRRFSEFLAQKLVYSEFLDFVVIGTWLLEPNAAPPCLSLLTRARICCMPKTLW
jgi:hypothetical protein